MSESAIHRAMISTVALALGPELLDQVAFVGGCTTSLLITDDFSRDQVRHTHDVDLILHVVGHAGWAQLQEQLRAKGFKDITDHAAPICALQLGELRVDFMPDNEQLLGFSNRWYEDALKTAETHELSDGIRIRLVTPPYFIATKLEAFKGRGNSDPLASQDIEDILNLFNGRETLVEEIGQAPSPLRKYISNEIRALLQHPGMAHAIEGSAPGQPAQVDYLYELLEVVASREE